MDSSEQVMELVNKLLKESLDLQRQTYLTGFKTKRMLSGTFSITKFIEEINLIQFQAGLLSDIAGNLSLLLQRITLETEHV